MTEKNHFISENDLDQVAAGFKGEKPFTTFKDYLDSLGLSIDKLSLQELKSRGDMYMKAFGKIDTTDKTDSLDEALRKVNPGR